MTTPPYRPQHTPQPHPPHRPQHTGQHANAWPYVPVQRFAPPAQLSPAQLPPPAYPAPYAVTSTPHVIRGDRNGMGTAGLVLGITALCFAVIPIVGLVAWVLWPLGAIFSGVGLGRANAATATNRTMALAGMIVSIVAAAVCIGWVLFTAYATTRGA